MKPEKVRDWLKKNGNLDRTIDKFFREQFKMAVFMAGIPGAGKTELVRRLTPDPFGGFTIIEHDELVKLLPNYKPELAYNYRPAGSALISAILKRVWSQGQSFIIDTTLSSSTGKNNIKKTLARGYNVTVIHVHQSPDQAWHLTQKREIVTKRGISRDGFVATCQKINGNLLAVFENHQDNPLFRFAYVDKASGSKNQPSKITTYKPPDPKTADFIKKQLSQEYNL